MTPRDFNEKLLAGWGGADVFNQAVAIAAHGQVVSAEWDDAARKATGKISQSSGWDMPTGFTLSKKKRRIVFNASAVICPVRKNV